MGSFHDHLTEAMALNRARRPLYARRTRGRSLPLSTALIAMERAALPVAAWLDARARRFDGVVRDDFVSMASAPSVGAGPILRGEASRAARHRLRRALVRLRRGVVRHAFAGRFGAAADAARSCLAEVDAVERAEGAHFAMSRHLVESVGFAAENAVRHGLRSGGATDRLARDLVVFQALALPLAVRVDRAAQRFHRDGVGIVVDDVPPIPFPAGAKIP